MMNFQEGRKSLQVDFCICFSNILKFIHFWGWFVIILENKIVKNWKEELIYAKHLFSKTTFFLSTMLFFEITSFKMPKCKHQKLLHFFGLLLTLNHDTHICIRRDSSHTSEWRDMRFVFQSIESFGDCIMKSNQKYWDIDIVWKFLGESFNFPFQFDDGLVVLILQLSSGCRSVRAHNPVPVFTTSPLPLS